MTLGELITGEAGRDAIHVAISPTVAPTDLYPGQHVDRDGNPGGDLVGIVDPFLTHRVMKGERFYICLYQNTVTSLRHEWTHPKFEAVKTRTIEVVDKEAESRRWIATFANDINQDYDDLMEAARRWVATGNYTNAGSNEDYNDVGASRWSDFWKHYSVITQTRITEIDDTVIPFACSC